LDEQHWLLQSSTEEVIRRYPEQLDRQLSPKVLKDLDLFAANLCYPFIIASS
jgi:hypothetical protein